MRKVVSIVGARPQFIKLGPFSKEIRKYFNEVIIHTGQHFDQNMSQLFFDQLQIPKPNYSLGIGGGSHAEQTGAIMKALEGVLQAEKPDFAVVFGDTNSTLAGALVASKLNIPLIHIEAGLRSFNMAMPEEINRKITDHISDFLFVPTVRGIQNLRSEGLSAKSFLTGDIMVDSLAQARLLIESTKTDSTDFTLLTLHRPYNVDDPKKLFRILDQLIRIKKRIVFPVHPRTQKILGTAPSKYSRYFEFIDPLGYLEFVKLLETTSLVITDSGGIQKEAYLVKKPCVTLRPETEWIETVDSGWNLLVNPDEDAFWEKIVNFSPPETYSNIFGENVSKKMVDLIKKF